MQLNPFKWFEKKDYDLSNPMLSQIFGYAPTTSGIAVTPTSALSVPAVSSAVRVISESIAALPLHVFKRDGDVKEKDKGNPLYRIVHDAPNNWSSSYDFRLQLMTDVLLHGNGYAYVNKIAGRVMEMTRLPPGSVTVSIDASSGQPIYAIKESAGGTRTCSYTEILHVRALSTDGVCGIAPIHLAREAIALALALEGHAAKLMNHAGRPSGVLKFKGLKLTEPQLSRIKTQWRASHTGGEAGGTAIFDSDTDFQPLTFSSVDLEFSAMRVFQINEIGRAFRIAPHLLGDLSRATWSNTAEMNQSFLDTCLSAWLKNIEGALTRTLLTPEEQVNSFIEFDTGGLTRANIQVRSESYLRSVGGPWQTANEVRAIENKPPIENGDVLNKTLNLPSAANDNNEPKKDAA